MRNNRLRIAICIALLYTCAMIYYQQFFSVWASVGLATLLSAEFGFMFYIGYQILSRKSNFPYLIFFLWIAIISGFRFIVVFYILQHSLPVYTVFHYPSRSVAFIVITTGLIIFSGYSFSIYEWGLAARDSIRASASKSTFSEIIRIKSDGKVIHLIPDNIISVVAQGEYVQYITTTTSYMSFQRLKKADNDLKGLGFCRVHRSFIVNVNHVRAFSGKLIEMNDGRSYAMSKTYKDHFESMMENILG